MDKQLKHIYQLALSIEKRLENSRLSENDCKLFSESLLSSNSEKIKKLSQRVKVGMDQQQFLCFVVPLERELKNKITDSEILVETRDIKKPAEIKQNDLIIVLDNIRSSFNMGAAVRTCDALGVKELIVTGYTPDYENETVKKISMGAWKSVELLKLRDLNEVKNYLAPQNYQLVGVETAAEANSVHEVQLKLKTALLFGNERFGLSQEDLKSCDQLVKLPVFGIKNSLNINAALTACGYEWVRQNG